MGIIRRLAVILTIFEGIVIQCDGSPSPIPPDRLQDSQILRITNTENTKIMNKSASGLDGQSKNPIVDMIPHTWQNEDIYEYYDNDELYLAFGNFDCLESFLQTSSEKVKRITIKCDRGYEDKLLTAMNIVKKYLVNLDELQIRAQHDERLWDELSNEENDNIFRKVKKFVYFGRSDGIGFNLKSIFPDLESVVLGGPISDSNCLADVDKLQELHLCTPSIQEHQLDSIFEKNKNLRNITLYRPNSTQTMGSIATKLTKLKSFYVTFPGKNFLFQNDNPTLPNLPSVEQFMIMFFNSEELRGNLSFSMPNLKRIRFIGEVFNSQITRFIGKFERLDIVEVVVPSFPSYEVEFIKKTLKLARWTVTYHVHDGDDKQFMRFEHRPRTDSFCYLM